MAYERGDVVLVKFPFSEAIGSKIRPAVVMSTPEYEREMGAVIVALITGRLRGGPFEHRLKSWREAGLVKPSIVRAKVATLGLPLVWRKSGRLARDDLRQVEVCIQRAMGLTQG